MVNFNLYPWRKCAEVYYKKKFINYLIIVMILTMLIVLDIHYFLLKRKNNLLNNIVVLQKELTQLNQLNQLSYKENHLKAKHIAPLQQYQIKSNLLELANLFVELNKTSELNLCFTEIKQDDLTIKFFGLAHSVTDLTLFSNKWKTINLFSSVEINHIEHQENGLMRFMMTMSFR